MELRDLKLKDIQPSQFYISEKKLRDVEAWLHPDDLSDFDPIPIRWLDGVPVMTDGHTRAVAALQAGLEAVPLMEELDDLNWEMYRRCVEACRIRRVFSPHDLKQRILTEEEYEEKWNRWCDTLFAEVLKDQL